MDHWPYCEIDGCHDSRTHYLSDLYTSGTDLGRPYRTGVAISPVPPRDAHGGQRLCRAHGLLIWRVW